MVGGHGGAVAVYVRAGQETGLSGLSFSPAHEMMAPRLKADFSLQLILSRNILKDVPRCVPVSHVILNPVKMAVKINNHISVR